MAQKKTEIDAYDPVPIDESSTELESEYYDRFRPGKSSRTLGFIFISYSLLLVSVTLAISSLWFSKRMLHGAGVVDTPLRSAMRYEPTFFERGWKANYTLMGTPSPEMDDAWDGILQHYYSEVPYEFMKALGRLDEGIRLDNGNYIATYGVMHQIHCLKRIHHAFYPEYYFPDWTDKEKALERKHTFHCLQSLLEVTMCKADEAPLTMRWLDDVPKPNGNPVIAHECVNWDLLMEEFTRIRVDPSVFVHPKFGKPWPDDA